SPRAPTVGQLPASKPPSSPPSNSDEFSPHGVRTSRGPEDSRDRVDMRWLTIVRDAVLDAVAVLLPVECAGCGTPDRALCDSCRAALLAEPVPHRTPGGVLVRAAVPYDGVV